VTADSTSSSGTGSSTTGGGDNSSEVIGGGLASVTDPSNGFPTTRLPADRGDEPNVIARPWDDGTPRTPPGVK